MLAQKCVEFYTAGCSVERAYMCETDVCPSDRCVFGPLSVVHHVEYTATRADS